MNNITSMFIASVGFSHLTNLNGLFRNILGIYIDIFDKEKYEKISDYDHAKNNSYKLLCLSSQLLKEAAQYNIKTWSTLPRPSHGIGKS